MWIETQDGSLLNLANATKVAAAGYYDGWAVISECESGEDTIARCESEAEARALVATIKAALAGYVLAVPMPPKLSKVAPF